MTSVGTRMAPNGMTFGDGFLSHYHNIVLLCLGQSYHGLERMQLGQDSIVVVIDTE